MIFKFYWPKSVIITIFIDCRYWKTIIIIRNAHRIFCLFRTFSRQITVKFENRSIEVLYETFVQRFLPEKRKKKKSN